METGRKYPMYNVIYVWKYYPESPFLIFTQISIKDIN